jgi:hypothetical protein
MPDLINNGNSEVAYNYRKMTPQTTYGGEYYSNFGTRQLAWFKIALANVHDNGFDTSVDSLFGKAVRGLQLNTEVYFISMPSNASPDYFVVAVAADTTPDNSNDGSDDVSPTQAELLKRIVDRATGGNSTVTTYTF